MQRFSPFALRQIKAQPGCCTARRSCRFGAKARNHGIHAALEEKQHHWRDNMKDLAARGTPSCHA
ncbi:hypothetical protein [Rhizobium sp. SL86]|uniref:hypothetical protein n=1 Tax=Rhizobium sp. SL86 TaxID=2995148 RepID=UPI0022745768|nr:hypothetical protein [Rhizobium sp. SL86]MCY1668208.1 hypothetical protein [Rhizobium sp. SL86]